MSQSFAERLGWIPKSEDLRMSMGRALTYAQERGHSEVTLEHFLLALIDDPNAVAVFEACRIGLEKLRTDLLIYIDTELAQLAVSNEGATAQPSEGFKKVMAHASAAAEQSQREQIDGAIVLAALIGEAQSHAAQILKSYGLTFEVVVSSLKNANLAAGRNRPEDNRMQQHQVQEDFTGQDDNLAPHGDTNDLGFQTEQAQQTSEFLHGQQNENLQDTGPAGYQDPGSFQGGSPWPSDYPSQKQDSSQNSNQETGHVNYRQNTNLQQSAPQQNSLQQNEGERQNIFDQKSYGEEEATQQPFENSYPDYQSDSPASFKTFDAQEQVNQSAPAGEFSDELKDKNDQISSEATVEDILASVREIIGVEEEQQQQQRAPDQRQQTPVQSMPQMPDSMGTNPQMPGEKNSEEQQDESVDQVQMRSPMENTGSSLQDKLAQNWPDTKAKQSVPDRDRRQFATEQQAESEPQQVAPPKKQAADNRQPPPVAEGETARQPINRNLPPPAPSQGGFEAAQQWQQQQQHPQHPQGMPPNQRQAPQMRGGRPPHPPGTQQPPPQNMPPMKRRMSPNEQQQSFQRNKPQEVIKGQLIENIPRRMRAQAPVRVEVRIAQEQVRDIERGMLGNTPAARHDVVVTEAMSVRLYAPGGGFSIEPGSPETQWIDNRLGGHGENYASWTWTVTPTSSGRKTLQLGISARIVGEHGVIAQSALPEQTVRVTVKVNYVQTFKWVAGWAIVALAGGAIGKYGEKLLEMMNLNP